jgi:hypothetical protein
VKDGFMAVQDKEFGLSVLLPKGWVRDTKAFSPKFTAEEGFFTFSISSVTAGDTAEKWVERNRDTRNMTCI